MKIGDLPTPGTPRWFAWRNSCLTIETWLAQEAAHPVTPLHEPLPVPPAPPPAPPTQRRATSAVLEASAEPALPAITAPLYGEPTAINPYLDPADTTRSHPSGGPLVSTTPAPDWQRDDGHTRQKRTTKGRVRRDTEAPADPDPDVMRDNSWWKP